MFTIILLAVLAAGGYYLLRVNTKLGREAVRAHAYLTLLGKGFDTEQANGKVDFIVKDTKLLNAAAVHAKKAYSEVHPAQRPVIGHAYRLGLRPELPAWYVDDCRQLATPSSIYPTYGLATNDAADATPEFSEDFATYRSQVIAEIKKLEGKRPDDLHYIELMDDSGIRLAYADRVEAKHLAKMLASRAMQTDHN